MENQGLKVFVTSRGGIKLNKSGYIYVKNKVQEKKYYWLCELIRDPQYKCHARITTMLNDDDVHVNVSKCEKEHNHEPDAVREKVEIALKKLKDDAKVNIAKKPCHIISDCEATTSSAILPYLPNNLNLRQIIYRQKKKENSVVEPNDILFKIIKKNIEVEEENDMNRLILIDKIYKTDRRVVMYTTKRLLTYLCSSKYMIMDGTFKVVPNIFQQLYSIHGAIHNTSTFPMVFILCTNKDKNSYNVLFTLLLKLCEENGLYLSPKYVLIDFEKAAHKSVKQKFENATIKGCNFYLGQIIFRQVQGQGHQTLYGTNESFAREIKCLYALAFLPAEEIPLYYDDLIGKCSPEADTIVSWFGENYVWGNATSPPKYDPKIWSTHVLSEENLPRTQNNVESWHNRFLHFVGQHHPGFYFLSQKIMCEIIHQIAEIEKLIIGGPPVSKKRKYTDKMVRIERIINNKSQYESKHAFLQAIAANVKLAKRKM